MRITVNTRGVERFLATVDVLYKRHPAARDALGHIVALKLLEIIHDHLDDQDLGWVPLKPEYLEYKIRHDLNPKIWQATGELRSLIQIYPVGNPADRRNAGKYRVGIPKNIKHAGGTPAWIIAAALEFGVPDHNLPARPLFRPSQVELRHWLHNNGNALKAFYMSRLGHTTWEQYQRSLEGVPRQFAFPYL